MRARFWLHRYRLPLARPLPLPGGRNLSTRHGALLRLESADGLAAWGEAAPLPGLSVESVDESLAAIGAGLGVAPTDGAPAACPEGSPPPPSALFAIESALRGLDAARRGLPFRRAIHPRPRDAVRVNALLVGDEAGLQEAAAGALAAGHESFKLKVGAGSRTEDVRRVRAVREAIGPDRELRLDANRAWTDDEARAFARDVAGLGIAYVEEPFRDGLPAIRRALERGFPLPLALDESLSLREVEPPDRIAGVRAVVLKPTLLGLSRTLEIARWAEEEGAVSVITSSFESSLGLGILAECGACLNDPPGGPDLAMGLDTARWLAEDVLDRPLIPRSGRIALPSAWESPVVARTRIEEVSRGE